MKKKVVYVLGAGFSKPLGIPTMREFYDKARDLYDENRKEFKSFEDLERDLQRLYKIAAFFKSDHKNIEEIFSLIEMGLLLGNENLKTTKEAVKDFICYVIEKTTPDKTSFDRSKIPVNYGQLNKGVFGKNNEYSMYGDFVAGLFQIKFTSSQKANQTEPEKFVFSVPDETSTKYSIITLNYDMVIENCVELLKECYPDSETLALTDSTETAKNSLCLVKLHGSIKDKQIIPPIWNKNIERKIWENWKTAYNLLKDADHIRIIGYSLPEMDINVRYLLKSSILEPQKSKSIDIICKNKEVGDIYKNFTKSDSFRSFNFYEASVEDYLKLIPDKNKEKSDGRNIIAANFDVIEEIHEDFKKDSAS